MRPTSPNLPLSLLFTLALVACGGGATSPSDKGPTEGDGAVAPSNTTIPDGGGAIDTSIWPDDGGDSSYSPVTTPPSSPGAVSGAACKLSSVSNLDGVSITFTGSVCTFTLAEAAAGISIPYEITIAHDIANTTATCQSSRGYPLANGLCPLEKLAGNGQSYAIQDDGMTIDAGVAAPPISVVAGTYSANFKWDGKNWSGPSDYNAPEGAPFPVGSYVLMVDSNGSLLIDGGAPAPYDVRAEFQVILTP